MELCAALVSNTNDLVFFTALISVAIYIFFWCILRSSKRETTTIPEASGSWPLLGHLPLLARSARPAHIVLGDLADRFGAIFTVRLGVHRTIIVSSWEIAKECLTTHDRNFANRPKVMSMEVLGYNRAMIAFSPYGPYYRRLRKLATHQLLSAHRIELLKHVRESEVTASIKDAYQRWRNRVDPETSSTVMVDMNMWFGDIMLNIIFRMILGKRYHDDDQVNEKERKALEEFPKMVGQTVVSDLIPALRCLDIGGHERTMRRTAKELDELMQRWLDEHKAVKQQQQQGEETKDEDFMDVILSTLGDDDQVHDDHDGDTTTHDPDTVNKATCLVLLLAGADTTSATLLWAVSLLLNHKESLNKAQQELDAKVGRDRQVRESDIKNLPYLQAVIKETLRLYPPGPLAVPHEAIEDCTLEGGYHVSKGTRLMFNLYKIQRDSRVWVNPDEYMPDRFLTGPHKDWDFIGRNFEFIPFGGGRRMCPGVSLALRLVELSLASFLQCFEVKTQGDKPVDMTEAPAMTNVKATTLQLLLKPRLSADFMYHSGCSSISVVWMHTASKFLLFNK